MRFDIVLSQGRIADRTSGALEGAALTAQALEAVTGISPLKIGTPAPATSDDWTISLPAARETLSGLREAVTASFRNGHVPVVVANTCSAGLASLPVVARERPDAQVLWVDAHADFNTPATSPSGYLGGMVLAAVCGFWDSGHGNGVRPEQVIIAGVRDIDPGEAELLRRAGVRIIPPAETTPDAIRRAAGKAPLWIHVDWDALEPGFVPAAYKVPGGLLPDQLRVVLDALPRGQIAGIELAEFEALENDAANDAALSILEHIVAPLFRAM